MVNPIKNFRSVRRAPAWSHPSTDLRHFSIMVIKQCWTLKPFRKPHWNFENSLSKYGYIWLYIRLSYTWLKVERILIGLYFFLSVLPSFFKTGLTSAYFNAVGKVKLDNELLKLWCMKKVTKSLFSLITLTGIIIQLRCFL